MNLTYTQNYNLYSGEKDEMLLENGMVSSHWQNLNHEIDKLGLFELENRHNEIKRLIKENGVTYSVYKDPNGLNRPWQLDPLPYLIPQDRWQTIEKGLIQRAHLLDLIAKDIYGEQKIIKNRIVPLELIYGHSGFLRSCVQMNSNINQFLTIYAADMALGSDGRVWVLNDRTQAPSGLGYSLENRSVMSRVFPEWFQNSQVRKLTSFFKIYRKTISALCLNKEDPRIVVLTPGQRNETYFEQAFLANYLGITLVQGEDLTIQNDKVWIRSIRGLEQVDIILRRVDDNFCDPLELRADSRLGVPGLLQAVRKKNVIIANPIGSSILENVGLQGFLPSLSKYFLNEELISPHVATWWCGQEKEQTYVFDNLNNLIVKKIDKAHFSHSIIGWELSNQQLYDLKEEIKQNPKSFAAQEHIQFTTTPSFSNCQIESRFSVFRCSILGTGSTYQVMPGGLARSAAERGSFIISNQAGGISKDTWVLGMEPKNTSEQIHIGTDRDHNNDFGLPSRMAENLFWIGRYTERITSTARLMRTLIASINERSLKSSKDEKVASQFLLKSFTHFTSTYPGFLDENNKTILQKPDKELIKIARDLSIPGSLPYSLQSLFRSVNEIRSYWSSDIWRVLESLEQGKDLLNKTEKITLAQLQNHLDQKIINLTAFVGLVEEGLTKEQGWDLFDLGRRIEKSLGLLTLIRSTLVNKASESAEYLIMETVLDGLELQNHYRHKYRSHLNIDNILHLILLDSTNPRSLTFQLKKLDKRLKYLASQGDKNQNVRTTRLAFELTSSFKLSMAENLAQSKGFLREDLDYILSTSTSKLYEINDLINQNYFSHSHIKLLDKPIIDESSI